MILTILVIYMIAMLLVGLWANKFNNIMSDFLLAGRRLGIWLSSFALAATYFSGGLVVGLSHCGSTVAERNGKRDLADDFIKPWTRLFRCPA
jgi:Na+/proline symporter